MAVTLCLEIQGIEHRRKALEYWTAVVGYHEARAIPELSHSASYPQSSSVINIQDVENWRSSQVPTMSNADTEVQEQRPLLRSSLFEFLRRRGSHRR
jgi:hypothetical protein